MAGGAGGQATELEVACATLERAWGVFEEGEGNFVDGQSYAGSHDS